MSALMRAHYYKIGYRLGKMPWDTGKPQPSLVALEQEGHVRGKVLDIGCGAGDNAVHLASRGHMVFGIDLSAAAIERAQRAAAERGVAVAFKVANVFSLSPMELEFDTAIDYVLPRNPALHRIGDSLVGDAPVGGTADPLAARWHIDVRTSMNPTGELRGYVMR
jgi:SAM-dependent methyltransferase